MSNIQLPEAFISRMSDQLGDELDAFLCALEDKPVRGIRMNPLKKAAETGNVTLVTYSDIAAEITNVPD